MPLTPGTSRATVSNNIREMMAAGHPQKQAVAAALREARQSARRKKAALGRALPLTGAPGQGANDHVYAGPLHSTVPGRTDKINLAVKPGSYVVPADVVSIIGEGNTLNGSAVLKAFFGGRALTGSVQPPEGRPNYNERRMERHMMMPGHMPHIEGVPSISAGMGPSGYADGGRNKKLPPLPMPPPGQMWNPWGQHEAVPISRVEGIEQRYMNRWDASDKASDPEYWKNDPDYNLARPGAKKRQLAAGGSDADDDSGTPEENVLRRPLARETGYPVGGYYPLDLEGNVIRGNAKYGELPKRYKTFEQAEAVARKELKKRGIPLQTGGASDPQTQGAVPVVVAGGEHIIDPDEIKAVFGDLAHGHKSLDNMVLEFRRREIERLKHAPPPKK